MRYEQIRAIGSTRNGIQNIEVLAEGLVRSEVEAVTRMVLNEIDGTSSGWHTMEITQQVLGRVIRRMDDALPLMVKICLPKMVEQYFPHEVERSLDKLLRTKVHILVSERFHQLQYPIKINAVLP